MKTHSSLIKWSLTTIPAIVLLTFSRPVYAGWNWTTLDDPDATINGTANTHASGISGTNVVGYYQSTATSQLRSHGFLYDGSSYTVQDGPALNSVPTSTLPVAHGISGSNIVGWYGDSSTGTIRGYLYNGSTSTYSALEVPALNESQTYAFGIQGSNIVGAYYRNDNSFANPTNGTYGFLYDGTSYTTLNDPSAHNANGDQTITYAFGISGSNIVGAFQDGNTNFHGYLYNGSTYTTLDDPLGTQTWAYGIDGTNIVGYYEDSNFKYHGFLYDGSSYTTLDDPSVNSGGSTLALGISGSNIVGYYSNGSGEHGFIATATPEPSSLLMFGVGTLLLAARRRWGTA